MGKKCPAYFSTGKTHFISFDQNTKPGAIYVKMHGSLLREKCLYLNLMETFTLSLL